MLPNLLIVGPPKSGTTSIRNILAQHPNVFAYPREIHFFDENYEKGIGWYKKFFENVTGERIITEKTPSYFYDRDVPKRIKETLPDIKLLFILRNPIDRAYSHYWHNVRLGAEKRSFEKAIDNEFKNYDTFEIKYRRFSAHSKDWEKKDSNLFRYAGISTYSVFLKKWLNYFDKKRVYFMLLENLQQEEMDKLLEFFELEKFRFVIKKYNVGGAPKIILLTKINRTIGYIPKVSKFILHRFNRAKYPPMKKETRKYLQEYFESYNKELEKVTGLDLSKWRE